MTSSNPAEPADPAEPAEPTLLVRPADGIPEVIADRTALATASAALAAGEGPIALDSERAQGFRYSARACLVQLRRSGAGTFLVDPLALEPPPPDDVALADRPTADLRELGQALGPAEWLLHAATQDLPCLTELGLAPQRLFDTELAGRLLGYPRVALGTLTEQLLGIRLLKEHSAADWSTRPMPEEWLSYAALDVEVLRELRDRLAEELDEAGKRAWAEEEFAWLVSQAGQPPAPRPDPWRRTSGVHKITQPAGLALVRELWTTRDELARAQDRAPGRILPDVAISTLAAQVGKGGEPWPTPRDLRSVEGFRRRRARHHEADWIAALAAARQLPRRAWPSPHRPSDGPPAPRSWAVRHPVAARRLERSRAALSAIAEQHTLPTENLLAPDTVRRLAWEPPATPTATSVDTALAELGARQWQRDLTRDALAEAIVDA